MVNYLRARSAYPDDFFLLQTVLHIIYSWQSYYVLAREFTLKLSRKCVHSFVGVVVRKAKTAASGVLWSLISRNLGLIKCQLVKVGDHLMLLLRASLNTRLVSVHIYFH